MIPARACASGKLKRKRDFYRRSRPWVGAGVDDRYQTADGIAYPCACWMRLCPCMHSEWANQARAQIQVCEYRFMYLYRLFSEIVVPNPVGAYTRWLELQAIFYYIRDSKCSNDLRVWWTRSCIKSLVDIPFILLKGIFDASLTVATLTDNIKIII